MNKEDKMSKKDSGLVRVTTVNNPQAKGVIVTAETLLDLKRISASLKEIPLRGEYLSQGSDFIIETLEDFYNRIR